MAGALPVLLASNDKMPTRASRGWADVPRLGSTPQPVIHANAAAEKTKWRRFIGSTPSVLGDLWCDGAAERLGCHAERFPSHQTGASVRVAEIRAMSRTMYLRGVSLR